MTANAVLSNRDDTWHSHPRGLDTRQRQDSARNRMDAAKAADLPGRGPAASRGSP
ncbi:hypothetical protein SAMN04488021_11410 [Paracoccus aminovorans]|uniref:Uncharacterized protein n=1 Tax=Paracoccus aminovorans TaxID=34004 RepID=A0A1I3AE53_9RHOB|nr:hypothetical protein JCM7685_pAMV3p0279 [Paracoccus aminovorans]SFH47601.1 hypothetical protein SAMN04488021_11410 [Paracoccus aminovorans]